MVAAIWQAMCTSGVKTCFEPVVGCRATRSRGPTGTRALRTARGASWRSRGLERALSQRQALDPAAQEDRVGFRLAGSFEPVPDRRT